MDDAQAKETHGASSCSSKLFNKPGEIVGNAPHPLWTNGDPMTKCSVDFESRSTVALPDTGVYVYAAHESTDLWCMAYAFDDEPVEVWTPGQPFPERLREHVANGGTLRAHNAQFERIMWRDCAVPKHGFPEAKLEQFECSAAEAAAMSLPRSLGECARVTGVDVQKDTEGYNLMQIGRASCRERV